jgi:hypothetical protein
MPGFGGIEPTTVWLVATIVLLAPPSLYVLIRNTVKVHRQGIVRDLSAVFKLPPKEAIESNIDFIPSFEFVKYKYLMGRSTSKDEGEQEDFAWWAWLTGIAALGIVISLIGYLIAYYGRESITFILHGIEHCPSDGSSVERPCPWIVQDGENRRSIGQFIWITGIFASFAGGYLYLMRNFFRAVSNFDFGPSSYISAAKDLIASIIGVSILFFGLRYGLNLIMPQGVGLQITIASYLVLSFVFGLLPESGTQTITERSRIAYFKRRNPMIYKSTSVTPVDIIDGIDSSIRDRLSEHHIHSTQNLATANPLMLFVETPYGVYQIMDWVSQAQLCCSVGPDKLIQFWKLGIRTLFDLERSALNKRYRSKELLLAIGAILFSEKDASGQLRAMINNITEDLVIATIQVKLDDPHVHRLRQIYIKVGERIGDDSRRFSTDHSAAQYSSASSTSTEGPPAADPPPEEPQAK